MAFQISIGDVLMLSQLAWDIAQAFTSGRKSAPAQFQEVQSQLVSLSHALDSLKVLSSQPVDDIDPGLGERMSSILGNCQSTLEHLQNLVNKYMVINEPSAPKGSGSKQWRSEMSKNWKKVQWTREGGDLAKLQHNLAVHVNSLNLTVAVMNNRLSKNLTDRVGGVQGMLEEIYTWYSNNLKGRAVGVQREVESSSFHPEADMTNAWTFSLHPDSAQRGRSDAICENASFAPDWLQSRDQPVFRCQCQRRGTGTNYRGIHGGELSQYFLSPVSLIVRYNDNKSWKIWVSDQTRATLTSLVISDLSYKNLAVMEENISLLARTTAQEATECGLESSMVFQSVNPYTNAPVTSVLNMAWDTRPAYGKISNLIFVTNGHQFSTGPMQTVQLLHYRDLTNGSHWNFHESVRMVLRPYPSTQPPKTGDEIAEYTVIMSRQSACMWIGSVGIRIFSADCLSLTESGQENVVHNVDVDVWISDIEATRELIEEIQTINTHLRFGQVQELERTERLLFELPLGTVTVDRGPLVDSNIKVSVDVQSDLYYMRIWNGTGSLGFLIQVTATALYGTVSTESTHSFCFSGKYWRRIAESHPTIPRAPIADFRGDVTIECQDAETHQVLGLMLQSAVRGDHARELPFLAGGKEIE